MKISLITVSYNSASVLETCLQSVARQEYDSIEYIVVDGGSNDGTAKRIENYKDVVSTFVSEPDEGIYDAMNKGIALASGDVIGMINSDDMLADPRVIAWVAEAFERKPVEALFGDVVYVNPENLGRTVRYFPGKGFHPEKMKRGFMPPHPSFYVKREVYERYGRFDTDFDICADFELMVRLFLKAKISYSYLPKTMVKMRTGGASTSGLLSNVKINQEMLLALRKNGIRSSYAHLYSRYTSKILQLINRPS